jgi:hypothetical protein
MSSFTTRNGINITSYTTFQAIQPIHHAHVGLVIGKKGAIINGVASRFQVDATLKHSQGTHWPYIVIRGPQYGVEQAYIEFRRIANFANSSNSMVTEIKVHFDGTPYPTYRVYQAQRTHYDNITMTKFNTRTSPLAVPPSVVAAVPPSVPVAPPPVAVPPSVVAVPVAPPPVAVPPTTKSSQPTPTKNTRIFKPKPPPLIINWGSDSESDDESDSESDDESEPQYKVESPFYVPTVNSPQYVPTE